MRKLFLALVTALTFLIQPLAHAAAGPDVLVAHRGVAGDKQVELNIPENSIPAWDWAIKNCADIIDLDAQNAADGYAVMHDLTLNRTTNGTGYVKDRTLSYIKSLYLELPIDRDGNGNDDNTAYHPPSLNQALDFLKDKVDCQGNPVKIAMEMKGPGWTQEKVTRLADVLKGKGFGMFGPRVNVHAVSTTQVQYAKNAGFPNRGYVVPSNAATLPSAATIKVYADNVFIPHDKATPAKVNEYNNAGIKVWLSTLTTTAEFELAWSKGKVYAWVVNDLLGARDWLKARQ
jgi:glycerophosphoryl diester phosphodiesterase